MLPSRTTDGFLETVTQLAAEFLTGDADAYTAVFGQQVGGQVLGLVENDGERTGGIFYQVPSHVGHVAYVTLQPVVGVYQANECLAVVALLDVVHTTDSLFVGGIAADSPYRVRRVEDDAAPAHDLYRLSDVFFFIHVRLSGLNFKIRS